MTLLDLTKRLVLVDNTRHSTSNSILCLAAWWASSYQMPRAASFDPDGYLALLTQGWLTIRLILFGLVSNLVRIGPDKVSLKRRCRHSTVGKSSSRQPPSA
jgi:hypothetical protein